MARTPRDYGELRNTGKAVDELAQNQAAEHARSSTRTTNVYAQRALNNDRGDLQGMNELGNDLVKAHAYDRQAKQDQSREQANPNLQRVLEANREAGKQNSHERDKEQEKS